MSKKDFVATVNKKQEKRVMAYREENQIEEKVAELHRLKKELDRIWNKDPENLRCQSKFCGNESPNEYYSDTDYEQ